MTLLLPIACLALLLPEPADKLPKPLRKAFEARINIRTLRAMYRDMTMARGDTYVRNFTLAIDTKGDMLIDISGDDDGKVLPTRGGGAGFGTDAFYSGMRVVTELEAHRTFFHFGPSDSLHANKLSRQDALAGNPLTCGLRTSYADHPGPVTDILSKWETDYKFKVEESGPLILVRAESVKPPAHEVKWTLDPRKDYAILRMEARDPSNKDVPSFLAESQYEQLDGRWWPVRTQLSAGGSIVRILTCESAEFDRPEHPQKFRGIEELAPPGVSIFDRAGLCPEQPRPGRVHYMGNNRYVTEEAFEAARQEVDLAAYKEWLANVEKNAKKFPDWVTDSSGQLGLPEVAGRSNLWEAYVRRWILIHSDPSIGDSPAGRAGVDLLDERQKRAAWGIYNDCRRQAAQPESERKAKQIQLRFTLDNKDLKSTPESRAALEKKLAALDGPNPNLEPIFENLKKRLNAILRKGQTGLDVPDDEGTRADDSAAQKS